ncbi:hypothetical protein N9B82_03365 [Saprospiraceae bacterium]|nr:hypothetical protein [Saprospiraceae bacterium]
MEQNTPYDNPEKYKEKIELENDIFSNEDNRRGRPEFFMPPGTEVLKLQDFIEIDLGRKSKDSKARSIMTMFTIFWNLIVAGFILGTFITIGFIMLPVLAVFLFVGLYMLLNVVKHYVNRKKLIIEDGKISITEGPIKLFTKNRTIYADQISQLYVNKYFTGTTINDVRVMAHSLSAITKDNVSIRLVDGSNVDTVLYLEQEIERFLDITDRPVHGEILDNNG